MFAELDVSVTESPLQNVVVPLAVIEAVGRVFTVTFVADEVEEHPFALVIFTV